MEPVSFGEAFSLRRTLAHGWLAMRVASGPMWLGGLLMIIGDGCNGGGGDFPTSWLEGDDEEALRRVSRALDVAIAGLREGALGDGLAAASHAMQLPGELTGLMVGAILAGVLVVLGIWLALFALGCWVTTGFVRMHVGILEREDDTLTALFSGRDRFWPMFVYRSLAALSISAAALASLWPGAMVAAYGYHVDRQVWMIGGLGMAAFVAVPVVIYVSLGTFLGELAVALDGFDGVAALRRSFALARGNRFRMLWFAIGCFAVQMVSAFGLLLCCVGALATMPFARSIVGYAKTEGYLLLTRGRGPTSTFKLWQRARAEAGQPGTAAAAPTAPASITRTAFPPSEREPSAAAPPIIERAAPPPHAGPAASPEHAPPPTWQPEAGPPAGAPPWQPAAPELPRYEPPPGLGSLPPQPAASPPTESTEPPDDGGPSKTPKR